MVSPRRTWTLYGLICLYCLNALITCKPTIIISDGSWGRVTTSRELSRLSIAVLNAGSERECFILFQNEVIVNGDGTSWCWRVPRSTSSSKGSQTCNTNEVSTSSQSPICCNRNNGLQIQSACNLPGFIIQANITQSTCMSIIELLNIAHYLITSIPVAVLPTWVKAIICSTISWVIAAEPPPEPPNGSNTRLTESGLLFSPWEYADWENRVNATAWD